MDLIAKTFNELSASQLYEILKSRAQIFLIEQKIFCLDMDDIDYESLHCFFIENNKVIAYLRAFPVDSNVVKIGRVLTLKHGNGFGRELLEKSLAVIQRKMNPEKIVIHAQKYTIGFYEKFGFNVTSDEYSEEGVAHVTMELNL